MDRLKKNLIHNRDCLELFPDFDVIFGLTYWIFTTLNMWLHQELLTTYISVRWVLEFADIEISQILYTEVNRYGNTGFKVCKGGVQKVLTKNQRSQGNHRILRIG